MTRDPYSVLGVTRGATDREIKKAYRTLSRIPIRMNRRKTGRKKNSAKYRKLITRLSMSAPVRQIKVTAVTVMAENIPKKTSI